VKEFNLFFCLWFLIFNQRILSLLELISILQWLGIIWNTLKITDKIDTTQNKSSIVSEVYIFSNGILWESYAKINCFCSNWSGLEPPLFSNLNVRSEGATNLMTPDIAQNKKLNLKAAFIKFSSVCISVINDFQIIPNNLSLWVSSTLHMNVIRSTVITKVSHCYLMPLPTCQYGSFENATGASNAPLSSRTASWVK
jgi:hypothetical protein